MSYEIIRYRDRGFDVTWTYMVAMKPYPMWQWEC